MFKLKYCLIVLISLLSFSLLSCNVSETSEEETTSEMSIEESTTIPRSPMEITKFAGEYRDINDDSIMYMSAYGDYLDIKIIFSNEDKTYFNLWEMRASLDRASNCLYYSDAKKTTYTKLTDDSYSNSLVYEGGSGTIKNIKEDDINMCVWHGDMSGDKKKDVKYVYAFSTASANLQEFLNIISNNK